MKILAVTAHPDDFETGMGGLAVRLAALEHRIASFVLAPGRTKTEMHTREWESEESHELIGVGAGCHVQTFQIGNLPVTQESREALKRNFLGCAAHSLFPLLSLKPFNEKP